MDVPDVAVEDRRWHARLVRIMRRARWIRGVLAALAVAVLASCRVDTEVALLMNSDGTGSVTVTVVADAEAVRAEPNLAKQLRLEDLTQTGWLVEGPDATPEGGLSILLTRPFTNLTEANAVLASLSGPDGPLREPTVTATGSRGDVSWVFDGTLDFSKGLDAISDPELTSALGGTPWLAELQRRGLAPRDAASITVRVSMPGVPAASGDSDAVTTAREWTARPGDPAVPMNAETAVVSKSVTRARNVERQFTLLVVAYVIILMALTGLWFYLRSRRKALRARGNTNRPTMKMAELIDLPPEQRLVMRYLLRADTPPTPAECAAALGTTTKEINALVRQLSRAGLVRVDGGRLRPVTGRRTSRLSGADPLVKNTNR